MELRKNSNPRSVPSWSWQPASFHCDWELLVFKATMDLESGGWGWCQLKHIKTNL